MAETVNTETLAAPSPAQLDSWRRLWDLLLESPEQNPTPTPTDAQDAEADKRAN